MKNKANAPNKTGSLAKRPKIPKKVLTLLSALVTDDVEARLRTSQQIIKIMVNCSNKRQPALCASDQATSEQSPHADTAPRQAHPPCPVLTYIVGRLVRGLASSRAGARQALFCTLVVALRRLTSGQLPRRIVTDAAGLTSNYNSNSSSSGGSSHDDRRQRVEQAVCRILTAGALVRSLPGENDNANSNASVDDECLSARFLLHALLSDWKLKSYMSSISAPFIVELIAKTSDDEFERLLWPQMRTMLSDGWSRCCADTLWLLVACFQRCRLDGATCHHQQDHDHFLRQHWQCASLTEPAALANMATVVKTAHKHLPLIHPVVAAVVHLVTITNDDDDDDESSLLLLLCETVVEPLVQDHTAAPLALALLQMIVPRLCTPQLVSNVVSQSVVGCLMRLLPRRDRLTENAARGLASCLTSHALHPLTDAATQMALLRRLIDSPGSLNMDSITGTKTVSLIVAALKADALLPFTDIVSQVFHGRYNGQQQTLRARSTACCMLSRLVHHPMALNSAVNPSGSPAFKQRLLRQLFTAGVTQSCQIPQQLAALSLKQFYKALEEPVSRRVNDLDPLLCDLTQYQTSMLSASPLNNTSDITTYEWRAPLSSTCATTWLASVQCVTSLPDSGAPCWQQQARRALRVLVLFLCQHMFAVTSSSVGGGTAGRDDSGGEGGEVFISEILKELQECARRSILSSTVASPADGAVVATDDVIDDAAADWPSVLLDILLSLLSQHVHFLRAAVRAVFAILAPTLPRHVVLRAFEVLSVDYQMTLIEDDVEEDEDDEEIDGDDDDSSDSSDSSQDDGSDENDSGIDPSSDESVVDNNADESLPESPPVCGGATINQLKQNIRQALYATQQDNEQCSDIDMDQLPDEHFRRVDAALSAAFRAARQQRRNSSSHNGGRHTDPHQLSLMHFRIRVLDLVEVYGRVVTGGTPSVHTPSVHNSLICCLDLLPRLVQLLAAVHQQASQLPLVHRLRTCINQLVSSCLSSCRQLQQPADGLNISCDQQISDQYLADILDSVLKHGARLPSASVDMGSLLSHVVKCILRISLSLPHSQTTTNNVADNSGTGSGTRGSGSRARAVTQRLLAALHHFLHDKECVLPPRLFAVLLETAQWRGKRHVLSALVAAVVPSVTEGGATVRSYRRTQCITLLAGVFRRAAQLLTDCVSVRHVRKLSHSLSTGLLQMVDEHCHQTLTHSDKLVCGLFELCVLACHADATCSTATCSAATCHETAMHELHDALRRFCRAGPSAAKVTRHALQLYASICREMHVVVPEWRGDSGDEGEGGCGSVSQLPQQQHQQQHRKRGRPEDQQPDVDDDEDMNDDDQHHLENDHVKKKKKKSKRERSESEMTEQRRNDDENMNDSSRESIKKHKKKNSTQ